MIFQASDEGAATINVFNEEDKGYVFIGEICLQLYDYIFTPNTNFFTAAELIEIANYMKKLIRSQ